VSAIILCIETGGDNCSAALSKGRNLLALKEQHDREHAKNLSPFIDEILRETGATYADIDAVAVSKGPGSYTGLRIGVATAKGICYGLDKPLIAIDSLLSLASLCERADSNAIYCPMIDARRAEVYCAFFDVELQRITETQALIVDENSFLNDYPERRLVFFGNGAGKCKDIIKRSNTVFLDVQSSATGLINPAVDAYERKIFEDFAYFEPLYLKDFVAVAARKLL
jgi:tRNA threonylcarbamoyladenosine biosynthesis protein TsaB